MTDWIPIAKGSYPPDEGTPFLVARKTTLGDWEIDLVWRDIDTGDIDRDCSTPFYLDDFSHWMPLPDPPQ